MTGGTVILNSLEAIQNYLQRSHHRDEEGIETLAIDWLDLENDEIRSALRQLFLGPSSDQEGQERFSSVEVRKCMGQFTPMLIRWILEASVTSPIEALTLVSVVDHDVALALKQSLCGKFPTTDGIGLTNHENDGKVPNIGKLEIWGSALSELSIQLIFRGIYGHAAILACSPRRNFVGPIRTLSLSNCNFLPDTMNRMAKELKDRSRTSDNVRCQTENSSLQRLNLFSCRLSDDEAATLVSALHKYKHPLRYLDLGKNRCHHATFRALGYWLGSPHCKLESLNLSLQQLGFGVQKWNPKFLLDNLIPSNCGNGDIRAHRPPLKALYLRGNPIDDGMADGNDETSPSSFATSLVNVLTQNTTLEKLMLTDCSLSNESYDMLLQHLHQFRGVRKLWLDGIQRYQNQPKRGFTRQIAKRLMGPDNQNFALEELHLPFRLTDLAMQIDNYMDANFGGRRLLVQEESSSVAKAVPCSLWPIVLERINHADLPKRLPSSKPPHFQSAGKWPGDDSGITREQRDLSRRATILYSMIRENASLQHAIGRSKRVLK